MANELSKIKLPSGTEYSLKDAQARQDIASLQNAMTGKVALIGTTTTALADQATTNPIKINNADVTAIAGNLVYYNKKEFLFDGTKWVELGDLSSLGSLAYKNNATGSVTAEGTVSKPNFNGTESTVTVTATENSSGTFSFGGTVSAPTFNGASMTSTGTFKPNGTVTISTAETGTANYTPEGTISTPVISVKTAGSTTTIKNPTSQTVAKTVVAAAPGATAPANNLTYYAVSGETLSLYQIGYTTGASITTTNATVKTGDAAYQSTVPTFTGTGAVLAASFNGTSGSVSVTGTTTGSNSAPTFTPKKYNISGKTTAAGTVTQPTFSGTPVSVTVS